MEDIEALVADEYCARLLMPVMIPLLTLEIIPKTVEYNILIPTIRPIENLALLALFVVLVKFCASPPRRFPSPDTTPPILLKIDEIPPVFVLALSAD